MLQDARYGTGNIGDVAALAVEFLKEQGAGEFDHNAGRKFLAAWCRHLNVPYTMSVQIHADLPDTWNKHYEQGVVQNVKKVLIREQSRDPKIATAALRAFAGFCGRGNDPYKPPMNLQERQLDAVLRRVGDDAEADAVLRGEPEPKKQKLNGKVVRRIRLRPIGRGLKYRLVEMR